MQYYELKLHCPKDGDYRKHIYEGKTLCNKTGWIANHRDRVSCGNCERKLERAEATIELLEVLAA